jgi:hypothetical protein
MARLTLTLFDDEQNALRALSQKERRHPREQAALLIRRELERRGLLPADVSAADDRPAPEVQHATD